MRQRGDMPDIAFGSFLVGLALAAFYTTRTLETGTASDMGSGFVPRALAGTLLVFGIGYMAKGLFAGRNPLPAYAWRPLVAISAGCRCLCALFSASGAYRRRHSAIAVAGMAARPARLLVLLPFGAGVAAFSALLFVKGLGLPLRLWSW